MPQKKNLENGKYEVERALNENCSDVYYEKLPFGKRREIYFISS